MNNKGTELKSVGNINIQNKVTLKIDWERIWMKEEWEITVMLKQDMMGIL